MSRVALVTGGTRGIGRGIAKAFAAAGYTVAVCGRKPPEQDDGFLFVAGDVRDAEQVDLIVRTVVDKLGRLDVVVNNAGGAPPANAATVSPRFHESILKLNLMAPLHVAQRANAVMQTQDTGGVIVNIASVSGLRPSPGTAAYGAAKAGLISLTRSLAVEWAPKVRVVAVTPGLIATEQADLHYPDMAAVVATVPAARLGTPEDVGNACVWLASEAASYASGTNLVLEGGGERPAFLTAQEKA
jgi:NAD(P)-dependent dehydrogenase (short-subunit alcohol dehydrogenase family)